MEMIVSPVLLGLPEFNVPVDFSMTTFVTQIWQSVVLSRFRCLIFRVLERKGKGPPVPNVMGCFW